MGRLRREWGPFVPYKAHGQIGRFTDAFGLLCWALNSFIPSDKE